ncbi:MAG: hypothetical protein JWQ38_225 [Flavipsychrobacter sp.]|nr:hypothetical protein [Flavipsychrobacter sp.]
MKKFVLSCLCAMALVNTANAQVTFGPIAGLNVSNYTITGTNIALGSPALGTASFTLNTTTKIGGRFGAVVNIPLNEHFYLQPGVLYVMNGFKQSFLGLIELKAHINTAEVPVNLFYKFGDGDNKPFFIGAGPYFAYNVVGGMKVNINPALSSTVSSVTNTKLDIGSDSTDFVKAFDCGFGVNAGYQLAMGLFVNAHYQFGLTNLIPIDINGYSIKNHNYGISIGYMIGSKATKKTSSKTTIKSKHK